MGRKLEDELRRDHEARLARSEIAEMEKLFLEKNNGSLDPSFLEDLTKKFNLSPGRAGSRTLQVEQVERWFQNRLKNSESADASSPSSSKEVVSASETNLSNSVPESSSHVPRDIGEKVVNFLDLDFEAKSARDQAWYDVETFLAFRVLNSGESEVRVRFQGFPPDHDEWVNITKEVRERSIPLEASECQKVEVGDLVLCFRERAEQATYFDSHVLGIQRKVHDIRGCRCIFSIRYDHDLVEESVPLRRLCRRPSD